MRFSILTASAARIAALTALALAAPAAAFAQYSAPEVDNRAIGEKYHVELAGTLWNPTVSGVIASEQFGIAGTQIDLVNDLGFVQTRFGDLRLVLRPSKKAKFKIQYTPLTYTAQSTLNRSVVFNGINFPLHVPVQSQFDWKVLRLGYEYDFVYLPRGFVGVLLEARITQFDATLSSPVLGEPEFTSAKAPLPAIGIVGRGYVLPNLALNFELTGAKLPDNLVKDAAAHYYDWDIGGTFNVTNNVGIQAGWRKMTTFLDYQHDLGNLDFQGMWFGAVVRY